MGSPEMTSYQRIMMALEGGKPDCVPVLPFVRHWTSAQVGFSVNDILNTPEKLVYSQYYCTKNFGYDIANDIGGVSAEAEALGSIFKKHEDSFPTLLEPVVKDYDADLKKLRTINPYKDGRLPLNLEIVSRLKELCQDEYPVAAYLQAPFRCASMVRGSSKIYIDMKKNKENLHKLLEITTLNELIYGVALVHAGADILMLSDPTSSGDTISRSQWEEFGCIYTKRLVGELKKTGVKIFLHVCGNVTDRLDSFAQLGVDGISVDEKVDLAKAREIVGKKICLLGNVSPTKIMYNTPEEIRKESEECIEKAGREGAFILSGGCQIPPQGKPENIRVMVEVAHNYKYN